MAFGSLGRTPTTQARVRRNWGKMRTNTNIVDGLALQVDAGTGQITLVIASGEPLTQSTAGLALTTDVTLTEASSTLGVDLEEEYSRITYYG